MNFGFTAARELTLPLAALEHGLGRSFLLYLPEDETPPSAEGKDPAQVEFEAALQGYVRKIVDQILATGNATQKYFGQLIHVIPEGREILLLSPAGPPVRVAPSVVVNGPGACGRDGGHIAVLLGEGDHSTQVGECEIEPFGGASQDETENWRLKTAALQARDGLPESTLGELFNTLLRGLHMAHTPRGGAGGPFSRYSWEDTPTTRTQNKLVGPHPFPPARYPWEKRRDTGNGPGAG